MTKKYATPANVHIFEKIFRFCEPFGTVYAVYAENETEACCRYLALIRSHFSPCDYFIQILICGNTVVVLDMTLSPYSVSIDDSAC